MKKSLAIFFTASLFVIPAIAQLFPLQGNAQFALTPSPIQHFVDNNGNALSGGKVFTYIAGTTTKLSTYTDATGATANPDPIILNSRGEAAIWLGGSSFKFVLAPANDTDPPTNPIWTVDNISNSSSSGGQGTAGIANVKLQPYNAKGNGSADDTAAIQAAITSLSSGGEVFFPPGTYCIKSGPLTVAVAGVTLEGLNRAGVPLLSTCGTDGAIIAMSAAHDLIKEMQFAGSPNPGTNKDVIAMNVGCVECTVDDVEVQGGRYALNATGAYEIYILDSSMDSTYGGAIVYLNGVGGYIRKGKFDQAYPYATPAAGSVGTSVPSWTSATLYTAGAIVEANGYNLQAVVGGTSGGVSPATPSYGASTVDGSVQWSLVGKSGNYGVQCDGAACGSELDIGQSDFSGDEAIGFGATNSAHGIVLHEDTFGSNLENNILVSGSYGIQIMNNIFGGGLAIEGTAISFAFAGDDNFVIGNWIIQGGPASGSTGVYMGTNNIVVEGNTCSVTTCFSIPADTKDFEIIGNSCFSGFGASTSCVYIAPGSSDYYEIIGNDAHGSTTSVSDGGTGTHKIVLDASNVAGGIQFNDNKINEHLSVPPINAPTIGTGFGSSPSIAGSDTAGTVTVGGGGASVGTVTFGTPYLIGTNPVCTANNNTSPNLVRAAATSTILTLAGTMTGGDTIGWICIGNH